MFEINPFTLTGIYIYTKTGRGAKSEPRGGRKGQWGTHELLLHPETEKIYVKATGKDMQIKFNWDITDTHKSHPLRITHKNRPFS